ncbi:hypothetical protein EYF80_008650 [Liparis tanakae]|uniref:Uncharacterized protein n=1 Tax=Liparis tanakae TaxID=230148 RepID=A0A4Z2ITY6_9TELE|nr:hypothetical protein EYF80_008650 [Liparis tanakae]
MLLLLLLLVHEGDGDVAGGSGSLQRGVDQRTPDDRAWPRRHRATSTDDSAPSRRGSSRDGVLHGQHAVVFDDLLHQHAVVGAQTPGPRTPRTAAPTAAHAARQRTALRRLPQEHGLGGIVATGQHPDPPVLDEVHLPADGALADDEV